jgi:hypothetical protein
MIIYDLLGHLPGLPVTGAAQPLNSQINIRVRHRPRTVSQRSKKDNPASAESLSQ